MPASMHVHLSALRYFSETVRCGSMRGAANALNVAPSAVNRQVLKLEAQLRCPLFERLAEGVRLTAAGEILYHHVLRLERDLGRAVAEIENLRGLRRGHVSLACEDGIARDVVPGVLADFRREFPGISYSVDIRPMPGVLEAIGDDTDLGLGIAFTPSAEIDGVVVHAIPVPLGVVMPPSHALARRRALLPSDIVNESVVHMRGGIGIHPALDTLVRSGGTQSRRLETNSTDAMTGFVKAGLGIALRSPVGILSELARGELVFVPIAGRNPPTARLVICCKPQRPLAGAAALLLERIKSGMPSLVDRMSGGW